MLEEIVFNHYYITGWDYQRIIIYSIIDPDIPCYLTLRTFKCLSRYYIDEMFILRTSSLHVNVVHTEALWSFSVSNTLTEDSCSSIIFEDDYHSYVGEYAGFYCDIFGPLKNYSDYLAFRQNITFLTITTPLAMDLIIPDFYFESDSTPSFGTYPEGCFKARIIKKPTTYEYILYPVVLPNEIPFNIIAYTHEDSLLDFSLCSEFLEKINIFINYLMTPETVLPLSDFSYENTEMTVYINCYNSYLYFDEIGSAITDLTLENLILCQDNAFPPRLNKLKLKYVSFEIESINISEIDDVEYDVSTFISLQKMNSLQKHYKHLKISNVNQMTFTQTGFIFHADSSTKSHPIQKDIIDNLEILSNCSITLNLNNPYTQRAISGLTIYLSACVLDSEAYVVLGEGWDHVKNINDIKFNLDDETKVIVATPIYPVPMLNINKKYQTMFNPLTPKLLISDANPITQDLFMKISDESDTHYIVNANEIVVDQSATIKCEFNATIKLNSLNMREYSNSTLHNFNIENNIKAEPGARTSMYEASLSTKSILEIHWIKDRWPLVHLVLQRADLVPNQIVIILDETAIDYEEYYSYTYRKEYRIIQGNFDCDLMMKRIQFNSSDSHFSSSNELIFSFECIKSQNMNSIHVIGEKELPFKESSVVQDKGMKTSVIASIAIAIIIVLCIALGFVVYFIARKKFMDMLSTEKKARLNNRKGKRENKQDDSISLNNSNKDIDNSEEEDDSCIDLYEIQ